MRLMMMIVSSINPPQTLIHGCGRTDFQEGSADTLYDVGVQVDV